MVHRRTHPVHAIENSRRREQQQPVEAGGDGLLLVVVGKRIRNARNNIHRAVPLHLALALALLLHPVGEEPAAGPSIREAAPQLCRRGRQRRQPHRAHRPNAWSPPPRRSLHHPRCYQREDGRSAPWWWRWASL